MFISKINVKLFSRLKCKNSLTSGEGGGRGTPTPLRFVNDEICMQVLQWETIEPNQL